MMKNRVVSLRINPEEIAKARDGLITSGIDPMKLLTISSIIKATFYYGIIHTCSDPKSPPSKESLNMVKQKFNMMK